MYDIEDVGPTRQEKENEGAENILIEVVQQEGSSKKRRK